MTVYTEFRTKLSRPGCRMSYLGPLHKIIAKYIIQNCVNVSNRMGGGVKVLKALSSIITIIELVPP